MTIGLWDDHEGEMTARIEQVGDGTWAESVLGWLVDESREGRYWRVSWVATWDGVAVQDGYDQVVGVWSVDNGLE